MLRTVLVTLSVIIFVGGSALAADYLNHPGFSGLQYALPSGDDVKAGFPLGRSITIAVVMLAGLVFGRLYERLRDLQKSGTTTVNIVNEARSMFSSTSFYLALFAAPIVYGTILAANRDTPISSALILAFQNGFFWQSVMPKAEGATDTRHTGTS